MKSKRVTFLVFWPAILVAVLVGAQTDPGRERVSVLSSPINETTAVRFFFQPAGDYFHYPLLFRVGEEGSSKLHSTAMSEEGQTAYISISEMRELVQLLARSGLDWQQSEIVEVFGPSKRLSFTGIGLETMDVRVVTASGTARAQVSAKDICTILKPLDAALKRPRILWEFQGFRLNYGCKVRGFKYGEYADR